MVQIGEAYLLHSQSETQVPSIVWLSPPLGYCCYLWLKLDCSGFKVVGRKKDDTEETCLLSLVLVLAVEYIASFHILLARIQSHTQASLQGRLGNVVKLCTQ